MLSTEQKNALSMSYDVSLVLNLISQKIQAGQTPSEADLKTLPAIATYASQLMKHLLDAYSEEPDTIGEPSQGDKDVDVKEGNVE